MLLDLVFCQPDVHPKIQAIVLDLLMCVVFKGLQSLTMILRTGKVRVGSDVEGNLEICLIRLS